MVKSYDRLNKKLQMTEKLRKRTEMGLFVGNWTTLAAIRRYTVPKIYCLEERVQKLLRLHQWEKGKTWIQRNKSKQMKLPWSVASYDTRPGNDVGGLIPQLRPTEPTSGGNPKFAANVWEMSETCIATEEERTLVGVTSVEVATVCAAAAWDEATRRGST